jgi:hypothetical protein
MDNNGVKLGEKRKNIVNRIMALSDDQVIHLLKLLSQQEQESCRVDPAQHQTSA